MTDIFFELPLIELYMKDRKIKDIVSLARIHRVLYQIKKDYQDIERDIKNQTETPLVVLFNERTYLKKYMDAMVSHYERESMKFELERFNGDFHLITKRLHGLISKAIAEYRNERFTDV